MREILFRGKPKNELIDWVYGYYFYSELTCKHCIMGESKDYGYTCIEVIPETVGQYTGLKDKNGTKIFEGDIIEFFGMRGEVVQECGAFGAAVMPRIDYDLLESKIPFNNNADFCFNDNFISLWELWENYEQDDNPLYAAEVIGNIHDNPELLNAEDGL